MADKDVVDFLTAWDLQQYSEIFRDNDVDIKTLPLLTESMIKELIPSIGHRARFKSNLDEWRNILNGITLSPTVMETNNNLIPQEEFPSNHEQQILHEEPLRINLDIENTSEASSEISIEGDLLRFLNKTNEGKYLLAAYQSTGLLDNTARRKLCSLIINNELTNDVHVRVTSTRLHHLAHEITTIFKKEHAATYFIPYISYGPGLKRAAKGKLLDCLNNKRREYRKCGIINSSRRSSTSSTGSTTTETLLPQGLAKYIQGEHPNLSVEENLQWLRNSTEPWQTVEVNWHLTIHARVGKLLSSEGPSISQYLSEFPALKKPLGYMLIEKDFNISYPDAAGKLFETLPIYKNRIIELAGKRLKSSKELAVKKSLKEYLDCVEKGEESFNIATLLCIPYLVNTNTIKKTKNKVQWRPSKLESRDGFITHIKSEAELEETVTRRRDKISSLGLTLQPFIIIIGPSLSEITGYIVVVDDTFYRVTSIIAAVNCCFKILIILNAQYPAESAAVWYFIQRALYNLKTPWDKGYTAVNALLSDIGVPYNQGI